MNRLPPQTMSIPSVANQAADIVIAAFREAGMDPRKAHDTPMARDLALAWRNGDLTHAQFMKACRNLLILNPSLGSDR